jgi:hypothetical protein
MVSLCKDMVPLKELVSKSTDTSTNLEPLTVIASDAPVESIDPTTREPVDVKLLAIGFP